MFDLIVIGAGPGGYVAAIRAAQLGMKTMVVEKDTVGGTCLNVGCIPTKTLYKDAQVIGYFQHAEAYGLHTSGYELDMPLVQSRKQQVVDTLVSGVTHLFQANGIACAKGAARLAGRTPGGHKVAVKATDGKTETYEAKRVLIATGSANAAPPVPGIDLPGVITSTEALALAEVPKHMLVIGGGVIGIEFAGIYRAFGAEVTVVEFLPSILPAMDAELGRRLKLSLTKRGIRILESAKVEKIERANGGLAATVAAKTGAETIACDCVLVATGRAPLTPGLGLEEAGVRAGRGGIAVDENYETNVKGIFAVGDVTGRVMLAHVASAEGVACVERMNGQKTAVDYGQIPSAVFTFPEVASIGLSEEQLKEQGIAYRAGKSNFAGNGKAMTMNDTDGMVKVLASEDLQTVYGVHIIGPNASDLLTEAAAAMHAMMTVEEIGQVMHGHPTLSEVFAEAVNGLLGTAVHAMPAKKKQN